MKTYSNANLIRKHQKGVLAIGNFDGIHLGHQKVIQDAKKKAIKNNPNSILKIIDDYAYKSTFLMNIGDQKGEILDKAIKDSRATNILELGVYLGYSTIRILNNMMDNSKLTSIEANEKFAQIAKEHIEISGLSKNHILKIGKSSDLIPSLEIFFISARSFPEIIS